ncbi:MAG: hypothetical protein MJ078_09165, partial [Clostridia bacterium]|nr:hypothetical protein [Clostridia bacterium]
MKQKRTVKRLKQSGYALAAILFWVAVWHFAATAANKSLILPIPLPAQTVKTFWADCKIPAFRLAVATSLWHILSGFLIAVLSGTVCGILSGNSKFFKTLSAPLLHLIRSVPVAAFIFVAWLWVPSDVLPTVISALMVFPIIWSHIDAGLNSIDERLPE